MSRLTITPLPWRAEAIPAPGKGASLPWWHLVSGEPGTLRTVARGLLPGDAKLCALAEPAIQALRGLLALVETLDPDGEHGDFVALVEARQVILLRDSI